MSASVQRPTASTLVLAATVVLLAAIILVAISVF